MAPVLFPFVRANQLRTIELIMHRSTASLTLIALSLALAACVEDNRPANFAAAPSASSGASTETSAAASPSPRAVPWSATSTPTVASASDTDGDGIANDSDLCPSVPEDRDGFQDADGCPDPDNDNDSITDADDRCPNEPEDRDGVQDDDGCPER